MRKRRELTEAELLEAREYNASLALLAKHPSWGLLAQKFTDKKTKNENDFARGAYMGGPAAPLVDQRKIDYWRGFWDGCLKVLDTPEAAEKWLQQESDEQKEQNNS